MLHIPLASPLRGQMEDAQAFMTNTTDDEYCLKKLKSVIDFDVRFSSVDDVVFYRALFPF